MIALSGLTLALGSGGTTAAGAAVETKSGLTAVRLIGPRATLEKMAEAAKQARWTESRYDAKGRLVLPVPGNYVTADFAALLRAIKPYTNDLEGLQLLGPHGGPLDDNGIEQPDD